MVASRAAARQRAFARVDVDFGGDLGVGDEMKVDVDRTGDRAGRGTTLVQREALLARQAQPTALAQRDRTRELRYGRVPGLVRRTCRAGAQDARHSRLPALSYIAPRPRQCEVPTVRVDAVPKPNGAPKHRPFLSRSKCCPSRHVMRGRTPRSDTTIPREDVHLHRRLLLPARHAAAVTPCAKSSRIRERRRAAPGAARAFK